MITLFAFTFGSIIGSFLGLCVFRIPLQQRYLSLDEDGNEIDLHPELTERFPDISVFSPARSMCLSCEKKIPWYANIPLFSWLFLKGRCIHCGSKVSFKYFLIELLTAIAAVQLYLQFGLSPTAFALFAFICGLIVISFIDLTYFMIPDAVTIPGTVIGLCLLRINEFGPYFHGPIVNTLSEGFDGAILGAGFLYVIAEGYLKLRGIMGLGLGDVKLVAMAGALFGLTGVFYTIFVGSVIGCIGGLIGMFVLKRRATQYIPFGPYLAFAALLYAFTGDKLLQVLSELLIGGIGLR